MKPTGLKDRNGIDINVGDTLKWIRDVEYYKGGAKAGQVKSPAAEFIAGIVIELPPNIAKQHGIKYWCRDLKVDEDDKKDPWSGLPGGLRFSGMLEYMEVIENAA